MIQSHTDDDRGQVGIGTLIVFIAMVLVAAIAAGVLINTAGFLQTQAEATGEESVQQVSDNIQAVNTVGFTGAETFSQTSWTVSGAPSNDQIQRVELTVQKSPGANAIDLSEATIEYLGDQATTLTHTDVAFTTGDIDSGEALTTSDSGFFATREVRGTSGGSILSADDDRTALVIPLGEYVYDDAATDSDAAWIDQNNGAQTITQPGMLSEGDEVELTITTAQGTQTVVTLNAPDIMSDEPAVRL